MSQESLTGAIFLLLNISLHVVFVVRVLLRPHREPASRIAWVVVIVAVPLLGILAYLFFGETNIGRRRVARLRESIARLPGWNDVLGFLVIIAVPLFVLLAVNSVLHAALGVTGSFLLALVVLIGVLSWNAMPQEMFPLVEKDRVQISTVLSVEPSSTTMISASAKVFLSTGKSLVRLSASFLAGNMMLVSYVMR